MGQKILSYSTAIAISLLLLLPAGFTVHAQQRPYVNPTPKRDQKKNVKEDRRRLFRYTTVPILVWIYMA